LPNYQDVATFLKAPAEGTYYFDGSYRPVPLEQRFIGVDVVANSLKQYNLIMEATYEKVVEQLRADKQVMIFVHSRNEC